MKQYSSQNQFPSHFKLNIYQAEYEHTNLYRCLISKVTPEESHNIVAYLRRHSFHPMQLDKIIESNQFVEQLFEKVKNTVEENIYLL